MKLTRFHQPSSDESSILRLTRISHKEIKKGVKNCENVDILSVSAVTSMTPSSTDRIPKQFRFEQPKSVPVVA